MTQATTSTTPRRALVVVDVQNIYADGPLLIEYPPVQDSLQRIGQAMDAAHAAGIPIIVVQEDSFGKDTQGWKIHDVVASRPSDHHIHKTLPSAFTNTGLAAWLAERNIDTLSVVGYMTHNCNASTLFEARHMGLNAEFLSDATGAVPYANAAGRATAEEIHRVFSVVFESNFAAVVNTETWIAAVQAGTVLARGGIMASNARAKEARDADRQRHPT
ncbi:MAG: isochorismatase family protein [Pseudomonadota bacterium]